MATSGAQFLYANNITTTVSTGGTTAPATGTQETWTVASSTGFPAPTTGNYTCFMVADTAAGKGTETIQVTNVTGATWTVIRGAESTATVTHTAGFTVALVISANGITAARQAFTVPPATGNATTDSANIRNAIAAAFAVSTQANPYNAGGLVYLTGGSYALDTAQLVISAGVILMLSPSTVITVNCTAGASVDAITIGAQSAIIGESLYGSEAIIQASATMNARTMISNSTHSIQEFAYIQGIAFSAANGATWAVALVEFNGCFVNSGIAKCVFSMQTNGPAGLPALLLTGSATSGQGPIYVKDVWIANTNGPCMKITEHNPQQGTCIIWIEDVDLEHPAFPYHHLDIQGFGGLNSIVINRFHTENNNVTTSGHVAGININGASNVIIDGYDILVGDTANKYGVWIQNTVNNTEIQVRGLSNINHVAPVIQDDVAGFSVGSDGRDIGYYNGPAQSLLHEGSFVLSGDLEWSAQSVSLASTSVNAMKGNIVDVAALAAGVTVANPTNPVANQMLIYKFVQNGTGGFTVAWGTAFRVAAGVVSTTANKASVVAFRYDSTLTAWVQMWATTGV